MCVCVCVFYARIMERDHRTPSAMCIEDQTKRKKEMVGVYEGYIRGKVVRVSEGISGCYRDRKRTAGSRYISKSCKLEAIKKGNAINVSLVISKPNAGPFNRKSWAAQSL